MQKEILLAPEDISDTPVEVLAENFRNALEQPGTEEAIQRFLTDHPAVLARGFIPLTGFIIPKFAFGTEYVSDFLVAEWLQGWRVTLIELEPKEAKGFNKDGTPARRLAQALRQLAEWNRWIHDHKAYFAERLAPSVENLISHLASRGSRLSRLGVCSVALISIPTETL